MRRVLHARLFASVVVAGWACGLAFNAPAFAQADQYDQDQGSAVSFDSFHDQLAPYGYWLYSDRWGVVWQPGDVTDDFRPYYTGGHWANTDDYGWYWQSDYAWGDVAFHYGRWVNDPDDGWLWIPGYVWSPGWVVWRSNEQYIGWMPMPPDEAFLGGRGDLSVGVSFRFGLGDVGGLYGYSRWYGPQYDENRFAQNWVFVGAGHVADRDYRPFAVSNNMQVVSIIHQTRNITNYTIVNNYVVNRSVDVRIVERAAGRPIPVVRAAMVMRHPNLVTTVDLGQRVQVRMREAAPRGMGTANSAPPPPPTVINKLSVNVHPRNGRQPVHLFTRAAVTRPEIQSRFQGPPAHNVQPGIPGANVIMKQHAPNEHETGQPGNGMTGPAVTTAPGEEPRHKTQPSGGPGSTTGSGGSMTGPGEEQPAPRRETQPSGGPNGISGPSGAMGTGEERAAPRHESQPAGGTNGMSGPSGAMGPGEDQHAPRHEAQPAGGPSGMSGPGGTMGSGEAQHAPRQIQPAGGPSGMSGPGGAMGTSEEHKPAHREPQPSGASPNGMTGSDGTPRPEAPAAHPRPANGPPKAPAPENPPKKKEHPNPNAPQPPQ